MQGVKQCDVIQNSICEHELTDQLCCICDSTAEIHADAPEFVEMSIEQEILETGLKVVDMLAPYAKGGKIGKLNQASASAAHSLVIVMINSSKSNELYYL